MSNYLAIATVTATLRQTLQEAVAADVPGATVTTTRPDAARPAQAAPVVNVYLYQATPNAAWRNADLPTRGPNGQTVQRPRVALDLHYLLSFYGEEGKLESQRLMGSVVRRLHERPVLARGLIGRTLADQTFSFLAGSDLADEIETVKLAPTALSLEELSKLWSVFFQTPYTLSVAYQGTVVLIDGTATPRPSLPVRARNVYVDPFRRPVIEEVAAEDGADEPILANSRFVIRGAHLKGEVTRVRVGATDLSPEQAQVSDAEISVDLASLSTLRAGVQPLQVVHSRLLGTPPTPHPGPESNAAALVLRPTLVSVTVSASRGGGAPSKRPGVTAPLVTVTARPPVGRNQRATLLLRALSNDAERPAYTFFAPPRAEDGDTIAFSVADAAPGDYLVAVQIDGAESPLAVDPDPSSPTYQGYVGPKVTLP